MEGRQFHSSPPGAKLPSYATAVIRPCSGMAVLRRQL